MRYLSLALAVLALGCGSEEEEGPPPNTVWVENNAYNPEDLTVPVNTEVTWEFRNGFHDVLFEDGVGTIGGHSSGTGTRTFNAVGTYRYRCTFHSSTSFTGMVGSVIVE